MSGVTCLPRVACSADRNVKKDWLLFQRSGTGDGHSHLLHPFLVFVVLPIYLYNSVEVNRYGSGIHKQVPGNSSSGSNPGIRTKARTRLSMNLC